jgi:hypothetical protein
MAMTNDASTRDLFGGATGTGRKRPVPRQPRADLTGRRFGRWTVLEQAPTQKGFLMWKARCDCGTVRDVRDCGLVAGRTTSCGCYREERKSTRAPNSKLRSDTVVLTGKTFGRWTVTGFASSGRDGAKWYVRCECGTERVLPGGSLRSGHSQSCGCLQRELARDNAPGGKVTHGLSRSPEYRVWQSMIGRCYDPKNASYDSYGERGITVCEEWRTSFEAFYRDVGPRPGEDYSIERKDVNDHYHKDNVRWATAQEQSQNRRTNVYLEHNGERLTVTDWARRLGMTRAGLQRRLKTQGMTLAEALSAPIQAVGKRARKKC